MAAHSTSIPLPSVMSLAFESVAIGSSCSVCTSTGFSVEWSISGSVVTTSDMTLDAEWDDGMMGAAEKHDALGLID